MQTKVRWQIVIPACVLVSAVTIVGFAWGDVAYAGLLGDLVSAVPIFIAQIIFFLATLAISLTVFALKFFVLLAGYNGFSTAPVVELGWTLVRDVANMFFIVALLVIAFATILGREDYALKKTLGKLILMAIFINFSKLISQVIIDAAHVVTMTFLNALSAVAGGNLIRLFKFDSMRSLLTAGVATNETENNLPLQLLGASVLTLMMTLTALFMLGIYFIIMLYRVVMLWVLIIFSPLAYAAASIPATASISKEWWSQFTKNVISAPMMVFFMWLAFATIGNGAVLGQITDNNSLPGSDTAAFAEESTFASNNGTATNQAEFAPTISEATTWTNMAGFAVAIAFLYAGIEQVQNLGVRGGDKLNTAKDWGVKAALGVSAAATGAWWLKKNGERGFKNTKNRLKIRSANFSASRDQFIDKKFGTGAVAGMLKSGRYKDKISSDWEKAAESAEQIYDTKISTGKSTAGKTKLNLGAKAEISRERDESAGANKRAQERAKILAGEADIASEIRDEAEFEQDTLTTEFEQRKNAINSNATMSDNDKKALLTNITKDYKEKSKAIEDKREKSMADKAYYTNLETEKVNKAGKAREQQIAAKETVLKAGGLDSKYVVQYEQELQEEREKEHANLRPSEFLGKAQVYAEQARDEALPPEERKKAAESARSLLIAAQKKGSFEAGKVIDGFAKAMGADAVGLNTNKAEDMQEFMGRALGYGRNNFSAMHADMSVAEMRQFQVSAEHMAMDGDTRTVDLFEKDYDTKSQREVLKINTNYDVEDDKDETIGRALYVNLPKVTSSDGLVSVTYDEQGNSSAVIETDKDISRLVATYKSMKRNTRLHSDNKSSLKKLKENSGDKWERFLEELKEESKESYKAMKQEIEGVPIGDDD